MKKILLPALLPVLLALSASASAAEDRDWLGYRELMAAVKLDQFYALPAAERDAVVLYPTVQPKNKAIKATDVVFSVTHGGNRQLMTVRPGGRMNFIYNPAWASDGAMVQINQIKGEKMGISFGLDAAVPESNQWQYASLMKSVDQGKALIKKAAGMMSFFAPKVEKVQLVFARPATLKIQSRSGVKSYASDAANMITLVPDDALMKENPLVVASERPVDAKLE